MYKFCKRIHRKLQTLGLKPSLNQYFYFNCFLFMASSYRKRDLSQEQVEDVCDVNKEEMDVGHDTPELDQELHGPPTPMSTQNETNANKEDEFEHPLMQANARRVVSEADKAFKRKEGNLEYFSVHHPRKLGKKLQGLTTSMSEYESMLHCTLGSKANLEKNIEDALSRYAKCEAAIAVFDDLCSQQGTIDEAIDDSTNRIRDVVALLKTVKEMCGEGAKKNAQFYSHELEDAMLWHDGLLEEKTVIAHKIEDETKHMDVWRNQWNVANEDLLGLLLQYYKMFGKDCSGVLDNMQRRLELLQHNFWDLKARCDSSRVDGH